MMNDQCKITRRIMNALEQELLYLQTTRSREVEAMLAEAMEYGDLENNLEYDFAKAEQEKVSGRIAQIEKILSSAVIVEEEEKHLSDEFLAALRKLIQDCGLSGEQVEQYAKYVAEAYEERNRMEYDRFPEENCLQTLKEAQRICAGRSKGETLSAHMIDRFLRVPCEQCRWRRLLSPNILAAVKTRWTDFTAKMRNGCWFRRHPHLHWQSSCWRFLMRICPGVFSGMRRFLVQRLP